MARCVHHGAPGGLSEQRSTSASDTQKTGTFPATQAPSEYSGTSKSTGVPDHQESQAPSLGSPELLARGWTQNSPRVTLLGATG